MRYLQQLPLRILLIVPIILMNTLVLLSVMTPLAEIIPDRFFDFNDKLVELYFEDDF